tara:strand:+ start:187 stop:582 length:396 start_codon:yes stop_codon:yes gene_type:complete
MATTTATLQLQSSDLTGDVLSLNQSSTLRKAGVSTGLDQTTGVGRKTTTSSSEYILFANADYTNDKAHKLYIRIVSSNATEFATVKMATTSVGRLYGGDFLFIPWDGTSDVKITPSVSTEFTVEYALIFEA